MEFMKFTAGINDKGRRLDKIIRKMIPESKFNVVLLARCVQGRYFFETHSNNSTAKTPLDAFEEDEIPNDIVPVLKVLEEY